MLSAFVCRSAVSACAGRTTLTRTALLTKPNMYCHAFRQTSNATRTGFTRRAARTRSLKEIAMAPAGDGGIILLSIKIIENENNIYLFHKI